MTKQYQVFYKDEELGVISEEEAQRIGKYLLNKETGSHITIGGEILKKSMVVIRRVGKKMENSNRFVLHDNQRIPYHEYMKIWGQEQENMRAETPEEKAFRNYRCKFVWYYLLQVGFTNFFGSEEWKHESPHDTFKRFDNLIWKREADKMRDRVEEMEKYFTDNPEEIWIDRRTFLKYLPRTTFLPIVQSFPK